MPLGSRSDLEAAGDPAKWDPQGRARLQSGSRRQALRTKAQRAVGVGRGVVGDPLRK